MNFDEVIKKLLWIDLSVGHYIAIAAIAIFIIGMFVLLGRMKKIRNECRLTLKERYQPGEILKHDNLAHYLGLEICDGKQTRGKGVLVLTKSELYFLRLQPKMELCIPIKRITRILTPTTFLDVTSPAPLLHVFYKDENNRVNSVAWKVNDVESFSKELKIQRKTIQTKKRK